MTAITDFVEVQISLAVGGLSKTGFGIILLAGYHNAWTDRYKTYTSASDLLDDGFASTDPTYKAAIAITSQNPRPSQFAVGRLAADEVVVDLTGFAVYDDTFTYTTTVNGNDYTSTGAGTDLLTVAALKVAIEAGEATISVTDNVDGTYDVNADVPATAFTLAFDVKQSWSVTVADQNEDIPTGLTAIKNSNNNWYGLIFTTGRLIADMEDISDWVAGEGASNPKRHYMASADSNIADQTVVADTTSIAALLKAKAYQRSEVIYHSKADGTLANEQWIDAAWLAMALSFDPDVESATEAYKTLQGIIPDDLTSSQQTNIIGTIDDPLAGKNANIYVTVAATNNTIWGITSSGIFSDIILTADWTKVRMEEEVFATLRRNSKISYTDGGIGTIVSGISGVLKRGQEIGHYAKDTERWGKLGYLVTFPKRVNVPTANVAARILKEISWDATAQGAIHGAKPIRGTIVS